MMVNPIDVDLKSFEAAQDPLDFIPGLIDVTAFAYQGLLSCLVSLILHHVLKVELADSTEMGLGVYYRDCKWESHHFKASIVSG